MRRTPSLALIIPNAMKIPICMRQRIMLQLERKTKNQEFCKERGNSPPEGRQHSNLLLLKKGRGRLPHFNRLMQDLWNWVLSKNIQVKVELVKSEDSLADKYTRGEWTQGTTLSNPKCSKKSFGSLEVAYWQTGLCLPPQETQSVSTSSQDTSIGQLKEWMHWNAHWRASLIVMQIPPGNWWEPG